MPENARITRIRIDAEGSTLAACEAALNGAFVALRGAFDGREPEISEAWSDTRTRADGTVVVNSRRFVKFADPSLDERFVADTDELLERLRSYPGVGIAIAPLIQNTPDSPAWTVHVSLDDGEAPHDFRATTLRTAADNALAYVEAQQPR